MFTNYPPAQDITYKPFTELQGVNVHAFQLQGDRDYQEDRLDINQMTCDLADNGIRAALSRTGEKLGRILSKAFIARTTGSTATVALILNNRIYILQIGDSSAKIFTSDFYPESIMSTHSGELRQPNTCFGLGLGTQARLAMTRSFGDRYYSETTHSHVPEIHVHEIIDTDSYLILQSDGLDRCYCHKRMNAPEISGETDLAKKLAAIKELASKHDSDHPDYNWEYDVHHNDNCSVILMSVDEIKKIPADKAIFCAVYDGHGGSLVAQYLQDKFFIELKYQIGLQMYLQSVEALSLKIKEASDINKKNAAFNVLQAVQKLDRETFEDCEKHFDVIQAVHHLLTNSHPKTQAALQKIDIENYLQLVKMCKEYSAWRVVGFALMLLVGIALIGFCLGCIPYSGGTSLLGLELALEFMISGFCVGGLATTSGGYLLAYHRKVTPDALFLPMKELNTCVSSLNIQ